MSTASRRTKWHPTPPPPPSPKILYLPRRRRSHRRKQTKPQSNPLLLMNQNHKYAAMHYKDNLESLFYLENNESHGHPLELLNSSAERRERVEEREDDEEGEGFAEEKWRFQAEVLRAECNLLRMEREMALKKLEKNRVKMETTLRSAVQTLQSGRKKIEEGKNGNPILEEEIEDLAEKIEELHKSSRLKESQVGNYNNFDKKACLLQRRLENFGVISNENELAINMKKRDIANESRVSDNKSTDEAIAKEEKCSGHCKAIVLRIVEQVRAETEQWSQMQKMLEKVRGEMEELQASRDYWEREAHSSEHEAQSLRHAVEAWKDRALDYEKQVQELELKLSLIKQKKTREDRRHVVAELPLLPLGAQLVKERLAVSSNSKNNHHLEENKKATPERDIPPLSLAKQLAKEKRSLIRSLKENLLDKGSKQELQEDGGRRRRRRRACLNSNGAVATRRSPLRDIVNSSPLERQNHRIAVDYHSPESSRIRESFRK